jgi:hypothetical protein
LFSPQKFDGNNHQLNGLRACPFLLVAQVCNKMPIFQGTAGKVTGPVSEKSAWF